MSSEVKEKSSGVVQQSRASATAIEAILLKLATGLPAPNTLRT